MEGSAAGGATELDALIHERVRLAILCALAVCDVLTFSDLMAQLGTTAGNLSVHARKLEEAGEEGLLACKKSSTGGSPGPSSTPQGTPLAGKVPGTHGGARGGDEKKLRVEKDHDESAHSASSFLPHPPLTESPCGG